MTGKELKKILTAVKSERRGGAPHEAWVKQNRDVLMMQVRNTTDPATRESFSGYTRHFFSIFVPTESLALAARAVGLFLLVIGTVFGGGLVSAQAYRDAAPGKTFYNMKLAVERVQLFLAPNDEYRTRLHTEIADRRLDEIAKLAEGPLADQQLAVGVLEDFGREVLALQSGLEKLHAADPAGMVETAKLTERKMAVYQNVLRKAGASLPASLQSSVSRTRDLLDGVTIAAMAVIVEQHLAGNASTPRVVIDNKFEDRIRQAETKLDTAAAKDGERVAPKASQAKAAIAEAKELLKDQQYQAALSKMVEVAELTKEVEAAVEARAVEDDQAVEVEVEEVGEEVTGEENEEEVKTEESAETAPVPAGSSEVSDDAVGSGSR